MKYFQEFFSMERGEKSEKILEYLRDGIRSGTWDNSLLPKETELAIQFGVARGTVRHALEHLVSEGVIERKKRLGTMISRNYNPAKLIGAVLRYGGHFHEDVYAHLQRMTAEAGLCPRFCLPRRWRKLSRLLMLPL